MKTIYIVEFSSGEYEDFRKHIAGVSETLAGANAIKDSFLRLLIEYGERISSVNTEDEKFKSEYLNYKLDNYNAYSLSFRAIEADKLLIELNNN